MTREQIWKQLYVNQIDEALKRASSKWVVGSTKTELHKLPTLEDMSIPHWTVWPIVGKSPEPIFWYRLSRGIFNVNQRLRSEDQMDYLEERDLFHDVFGHTPILFDDEYTNYVRAIGLIAQYTSDPVVLRALSNVYWYTSEFGLVIEEGKVHAYGGGVISSRSELEFALGNDADHVPITSDNFNMMINHKSYITDGFQERYYVLQSWDQLGWIIRKLWEML